MSKGTKGAASLGITEMAALLTELRTFVNEGSWVLYEVDADATLDSWLQRVDKALGLEHEGQKKGRAK